MIIDGFRIDERMHRGGMADIWRVSRGDIDFPIMMKVPFLDFEGDIALLVGFEVEQMIMAEVTGPHVPQWVVNGDYSVQPYIVMEYVAGPSLLARSTNGLCPIEDVVNAGIAVAAALSDLHEQHVLHLDLKPANILFRPAAWPSSSTSACRGTSSFPISWKSSSIGRPERRNIWRRSSCCG